MTDLTLVVSPHLDDAVFSIGAWIASRPEPVVVATVFAGVPAPDVPASFFDASFRTAERAVLARRDEDRHACAQLRAHTLWGPFFDQPYAPDFDDVDEVGDWITWAIGSVGATRLVRPLGVRHPQHALAAAGAALARGVGIQRVAYAELPYAALWPDLVPDPEGEPIEWTPTAEQEAQKWVASALYVSQYPGTDHNALDAPEHLWSVNR